MARLLLTGTLLFLILGHRSPPLTPQFSRRLSFSPQPQRSSKNIMHDDVRDSTFLLSPQFRRPPAAYV